MDTFNNLDDLAVVAIFAHFKNPYSKDQRGKIEMPLVGSCKRVLTIWMKMGFLKKSICTTHKYNYSCMCAKKCFFLVWCPKDIICLEIPRNEEFI